MFSLFAEPHHVIEAITSLRESGKQVYVVTTGATGGLLQALWSQPNASKNLLGFRFVYNRQEFIDFLGREPLFSFSDQFAAEQLAARAYWHGMEKARLNGDSNPDVIGLAMTSAVTTGRDRRGSDRVHVCAFTPMRVGLYSNELEKFDGDVHEDVLRMIFRVRQGEFADLCTLNALLDFLGLPMVGSAIPDAASGDQDPLFHLRAYQVGDDFPYGLVSWNGRDPEVERERSVEQFYRPSLEGLEDEVILFPGSFAPLHDGHIGLSEMIEQMTGRTVVHELTNEHPNKGKIPEDVLGDRLNQFRAFASVIVTDCAPLYIDKARAYPGVSMVVGADAAMHLLNPNYYEGYEGLLKALETFQDLGTTFYVVGRVVEGKFLTVDELPIPRCFEKLFHGVSFRRDISSSQIREARVS